MTQLTIAVGTVSGNALTLAEHLAEQAKAQGISALVTDAPSLADLKDAENLLVVCATTGQGDIPDNIAGAVYALHSEFPLLTNKPTAVIALGDACYGDTFCGAGRKIAEMLMELQALMVMPTLEIDASQDFDPIPPAEPWFADFIAKIKS